MWFVVRVLNNVWCCCTAQLLLLISHNQQRLSFQYFDKYTIIISFLFCRQQHEIQLQQLNWYVNFLWPYILRIILINQVLYQVSVVSNEMKELCFNNFNQILMSFQKTTPSEPRSCVSPVSLYFLFKETNPNNFYYGMYRFHRDSNSGLQTFGVLPITL